MIDQTKTEALATNFSTVLREWLSADDWAEVCRLNGTPEFSYPVCPTHNFCDANVAMEEAFRRTFGAGPLDGDKMAEDMTEDEVAYWDAAWTLARKGWTN